MGRCAFPSSGSNIGAKGDKMRDFLEIGSAPPDEDCAQLGEDDFYEQSHKEMRAYIELIRRTLGNEPSGAHLRIISLPHDFGTYYEVTCWFDPENDESVKYAFDCEGKGPTNWDDKAREELGLEKGD